MYLKIVTSFLINLKTQMPYKRTYSRKSRSATMMARLRRERNARYRAFARGAGGVRNYGGRNRIALRNARTGGLLGIERKWLDTALTATAISSATDATGGELPPNSGVTGCLTAPAQGDASYNREGNKIVVDSILLQGAVSVDQQAAQSSADFSGIVFVALVQDTQTNGTQLNSEDVFTNPGGSVYLAPMPNRNMSYTQRFKVLKMKKIVLKTPALTNNTGAAGGIVQSGFHQPFKLSWKGRMPVTFLTSTTTADIANVTNNSVQVVAFTSTSTLAPKIEYNCRVRFVG